MTTTVLTSFTTSPVYQLGYLLSVPSIDGDGYKRGPTYTDVGPYQFRELDDGLLLGDPMLGTMYFLPICWRT